MSRTPVHPTTARSEVQGLLDRIFQSAGPSEFKLPSSPSFTARDLPSATRSVATMVAAGTPLAPPSDVPVTHAPLPDPMVEYMYKPGPSPLLAPEPYVPESNIHDWLRDLDVFLVTVHINQRTCYLKRFLSTPARERAFDAGIDHTTPFDVARRTVLQLFHTPASTGMAAERFATLRQARDQSVDDFANQLFHLSLSAFPNLPPPDRDALILHRFITGLSDPNATDILLLHPPPSLSAAIQQCRLYTAYHQERRPKPVPLTVTPRPESRPPTRKAHLPVRFPHHNRGCEYCAAFGPDARHCGHNPPTYTTAMTPNPSGNSPPRRIPVRYRDEVDKLLDELLRAKIIQPSSSPWALPVALVLKKDGSLRLCVDYRRLNAVTVRDSFPLPRLDDTIDALGQAAWFSTLDLKSGYWQVGTHPNDRHKTAFTVPQGLFEFQTLLFGLCNAAATFQRLIYHVLRHLIPYKCLVYLDDIIVFGCSTEEHNSNLREVLEALQEAGLTLNPTKCLFLRSEVQFLGHLISPGRTSPLPDRIKHIPLPNVDDDAPPFILDTDASGFAIGAVLSQVGKDGVEHPICFASNTLTKTQRNYCTFRRELLAIVMFIRQFKHLLVGRRFILRTDHRALQWLRSIKYPMDQLARWQEFLQDFDFECQFRPGHKHRNADALSRLPNTTNPADEPHDASVNAIIVAEPTRYAWSSVQSSDPDTAVIYHHLTQGLSKPSEQVMRGTSQNARLLLNQWPHLVVLHDILFFRDPSSHQLRPVVPGCLVVTVLADLHSELGHCGQHRTELAARTRFWWPQLRTSVAHFCQSCATCASFKTPSPAPRAPMQPMITGFPGERVGLDIIGPLPISVRGYEYILVMVDYFTKWVEATPLLRQDATSVANAITRTWISRWGAPMSAIPSGYTDHTLPPRGKRPCGTHESNAPQPPIRLSKDSHEHDWDVHLPFCLLAYRGSVHSSTGFTPNYLWTGRDIRLPIDLLYPLHRPDTTTQQDYATRLRGVIRSAHNAARTTLGSSSLHQKEQHDRHSSGTMHQIGDLVMYYNPSHPRGTSAKFHYPWQGPFVVLDTPSPTTLLIRDAIYPNARPFTAHFDKLKPYRGRLPACSPDSLPILLADQVPPIAIEVTVSPPLVDLSTEDSAPP
ncbi:hypothetical protein SprV_0401618000 [Sparganum proliferum]